MGQEYKGELAYQPDEAQAAVEQMVKNALKPLAKIMLQHRMPVQSLETVAHKVFVQVAEAEFPLPGRKQSTSRIALLTGLTRKAVKSIRETPERTTEESTKRWNRAANVLGGWGQDPMFLDDNGEPRELKIRGSGLSFESLVKRYGGDMPVVTVLNELKSSGNVETINGETVRRVKSFHTATLGSTTALEYAGTAAKRLGQTLERNIMADEAGYLFPQHEYWSNAVPKELIPEFREGLKVLFRELGDKADEFLNEKEVLPVQDSHWTAGIGYYYFEEPPSDSALDD